MIRTSSNPAIGKIRLDEDVAGPTASIVGVSIKTGILLLLTIGAAMVTWTMTSQPDAAELTRNLTIGGAIGGLVFALLTIFVQRLAPVTAPIYAILEGLFLGGITAMFEVSYPGIAINTGLLTMGLFTAILGAYATGIVRVTARYKALMDMAIMGIILAMVANMVLGMFGAQLPGLFQGGMIGLGFSVFIVVIATLSLAVDFDYIQEMEDKGASKKYEWYAAFSLMVGLVWLYISVLRLLASRD